MSRLPIVLPVLAFLCPAPPGVAGEFDGLYRPTPATDCAAPPGDGGPLRVEADVFYGVEGQCRMTRPVAVRDMDATLLDIQCSGEGEDWTSRALFLRAADGGLILAWNGFAFKYDRCPAQASSGAATTASGLGPGD